MNDLKLSLDEQKLSNLMRESQQGNSDSYRKLMIELKRMSLDFARNSFYRMGLKNAQNWEDVSQNILLAVHQKRATYIPSKPFLPWFYALARYKIIDFGRSLKVESKYLDLLVDIAELDAHRNAVECGHTLKDAKKLFEHLSAKQREILELVKVEGLTIAEVEAKTGYSRSDIKVCVHRAVKLLVEKSKERGATHEI